MNFQDLIRLGSLQKVRSLVFDLGGENLKFLQLPLRPLGVHGQDGSHLVRGEL